MVSLRYIMWLHAITSAQVGHISKGAKKSDYTGDTLEPASSSLYY